MAGNPIKPSRCHANQRIQLSRWRSLFILLELSGNLTGADEKKLLVEEVVGKSLILFFELSIQSLAIDTQNACCERLIISCLLQHMLNVALLNL